MSSIAIIPARGGSKRIPRKNIRDFLGKPIIAYSITSALESRLFDEVIVSTDDEEIASVSKTYGASVPFMRSPANSGDFASTMDVIAEVMQEYDHIDKKFDFACCIYPTAPFVNLHQLRKGFSLLTHENYDTVFPIVRFSYPIWRALKLVDNRVQMIWPENLNKRSQDLVATFHDAGQWYWFNVAKIRSGKTLWTRNTFGLEISEKEVHDIDTENDWKIAEMKYRMIYHDI